MAGPDDQAAIIDVLTRAFHDDLGANLLEPDEGLRDAAMGRLFRVFVPAALAEAMAVQTIGDPVAGVAIWFGPDAHEPSEEALLAAAPVEGAPVISDETLARGDSMGREMEALHRRVMGEERHLKLAFLGVDPSVQGRGIGSRLVSVGNRAADERGLPVYLDTFTERDVRFYERRGYRVIERHQMATGPFPVWAMRRHPSMV